MSNIPTKGDLATANSNATAAAAQARVASDLKMFTDAIVAAMTKGDKFYQHQIANVTPEVERLLKADFSAKGWTLTVRNTRTGCTISWV